MEQLDKLERHFKKLANLNHLYAICGWDQAAVMPVGGNEARADAMAELAVICHQTLSAPELADLFEEVEQTKSDLLGDQEASFREMKRTWLQSSILPADLVEAQSRAGSVCEHHWREQRVNNDWQGFSKNLKQVVKLSQEEAQIRAEHMGVRPYDAMLDQHEPGMTTEKVETLFSDLKVWLPALIQEVAEKQKSTRIITPTGPFPTQSQEALGKELMTLLGFDFNHGRLDVSTHPFCGGVPSDVRITTRYDENDFTSAVMGVIHETGHARYEQGLPAATCHLPVGEARSMGLHESQSLFFEMQLARNPIFVEQVTAMAKKHFDRQNDPAFSTVNMQSLYTEVKPGLIRVDADEVTYPAHVILRYEIERDLIEGKISVDDIPELWDTKMKSLLGISTKGNYRDGCMQDIHWTDGSFGYFPSYTLGAMYAAQFMAAMKHTVDVDAALYRSDLTLISGWLAQNIWSKGSTLRTEDLVIGATGEALNPDFFKQHLIDRYLSI